MRYSDEVYSLLYTDQEGEVVGLDEVQLMKSELHGRIPALIELLKHSDIYLSYQSALILTAWGIKEGISFIDKFIEYRLDKLINFETHRIRGEDNVFDVIAEAIEISVSINKYDEQKAEYLLSSLLVLYGECFFESKLKTALLKLSFIALLPTIKQAIQLALNADRFYQASQLLPVIAKYDRKSANEQIILFKTLITKDKRIAYNIIEAKEYV